MNIARTNKEYERQIATETARMSYPSAMSRGKSPVVKGATKKRVEEYFAGPHRYCIGPESLSSRILQRHFDRERMVAPSTGPFGACANLPPRPAHSDDSSMEKSLPQRLPLEPFGFQLPIASGDLMDQPGPSLSFDT